MSFLIKVLLLCLNLGLIITIKSGIDKRRIEAGKPIRHGLEISLAIAWGAFVTWLLHVSWRTIPLQTALFWLLFDGFLSRLRDLPFFYVGSSWIDNLFRVLFGRKSDVAMAIAKILFLLASVVFLAKSS